MPIRIAIIGLSSSGSRWAANAHLPYLLSPRGRERYEIVALCNSSIKAAQLAIQRYGLSPETKTYGSSEALAADDNVELVVCCTRVDRHHDSIMPSVRAGKSIYLEWPIAHDMHHTQEIVFAARERQSHTVVGLQGRYAPVIQELRQLVEQGRIGKVLSSELTAIGAADQPGVLPPTLKYFTEKALGGNLFTIFFGHLYDQVQYVLGNIVNIHGHSQIQRPEIHIMEPATGEVIETVTSDVSDLIITVGQLEGPLAVSGATVLTSLRLGSPFPGQPALSWTVIGEKAEIRLVGEGTATLQAQGYDKPVTLELHDFATGTVEQIPWNWAGWQKELPVLSRSVGELYERFADSGSMGLPTFEEAFARHQQLDRLN